MNSILTSVKKALGIQEDYDHFDGVIVMHINSVFMILNQLGVGPAEGFAIEDESSEWTDFIPEGSDLEAVKTYVHHRVRLMFDPPNGSVTESMNRIISELEWRLNIQAETKSNTEEV
jgi:hypothetical protein